MLLAKCGEDEVGMGDGQKGSLGLRALLSALAPHAARAHGDERLLGLIAGALGVVVRVDKARKPRLLIGLEQLAAGPDAGHQRDSACAQDERLLQAHAA